MIKSFLTKELTSDDIENTGQKKLQTRQVFYVLRSLRFSTFGCYLFDCCCGIFYIHIVQLRSSLEHIIRNWISRFFGKCFGFRKLCQYITRLYRYSSLFLWYQSFCSWQNCTQHRKRITTCMPTVDRNIGMAKVKRALKYRLAFSDSPS